MRSLLLSLLIGLLAFGLVVNEASAKRFGGGRSFGVQRSKSSLFSSPHAQKQQSFQQRSNASKWGGILGGVLAGGLLASLLMGHGLGSGLLSWLIVGSLVLFIVSFIRRRTQPAFSNTPFNQFTATQSSNWHQQNVSPSCSGSENFDTEGFLRDAKVKFIRLQAAYDQKNLQDLSVFTAPEVFAEIKMQLEERGNEPNHTEVSHLNVELLDVSKQADSTIASVRFTGSIRENNDPATQLDEIWHFRKFYTNDNWIVGGIQQEVHEA